MDRSSRERKLFVPRECLVQQREHVTIRRSTLTFDVTEETVSNCPGSFANRAQLDLSFLPRFTLSGKRKKKKKPCFSYVRMYANVTRAFVCICNTYDFIRESDTYGE